MALFGEIGAARWEQKPNKPGDVLDLGEQVACDQNIIICLTLFQTHQHNPEQ